MGVGGVRERRDWAKKRKERKKTHGYEQKCDDCWGMGGGEGHMGINEDIIKLLSLKWYEIHAWRDSDITQKEELFIVTLKPKIVTVYP